MFMDFANRRIDMSRCHVMGVLNVTPDSFSDGGRFNELDAALAQALRMVSQGAAFIDVGGESTRPGAEPVSVQEELDRVCPVIEAIHAEMDVVISVDTSAPQVMQESVRLGAGLINDVRALRQPGALKVAAASVVPVCLMHMQGRPETMQAGPQYSSVNREVSAFLMDRVRLLEEAGLPADRVLLDPGFGFGKSLEHNLQLLNGLDQLKALGYPLLVGMSRKSMLGYLTGRDIDERLPAGLAAATIAAMKGASIIRAHDISETVDAIKVVSAVKEAGA